MPQAGKIATFMKNEAKEYFHYGCMKYSAGFP